MRIFLFFSPQWQLRHQNRNSPRSLCEHARIFEPSGFVDERLDNGGLIKIHTRSLRPNRFLYVFFWMVSLFLLLGCNLSYIVDLLAALHELASASARTSLKLASSVRVLLKPLWRHLNWYIIETSSGLSRKSSVIKCAWNTWRGTCHVMYSVRTRDA